MKEKPLMREAFGLEDEYQANIILETTLPRQASFRCTEFPSTIINDERKSFLFCCSLSLTEHIVRKQKTLVIIEFK